MLHAWFLREDFAWRRRLLPRWALALAYLRSKRGWSKKRLAKVLGMGDRSLLSRYERGDQLNRERLDALVAPLGYPPEAVEVLRFADRLISLEEAALPEGLTAEERRRIGVAAMAAGWTAGEWMYEDACPPEAGGEGRGGAPGSGGILGALKRATARGSERSDGGFPRVSEPCPGCEGVRGEPAGGAS